MAVQQFSSLPHKTLPAHRKWSDLKTEAITITHKMITKVIPKQFRFGNSSTKITE